MKITLPHSKNLRWRIFAALAVTSVSIVISYIALTAFDLVWSPLNKAHGRIHSVDVPLPSASEAFDLVTRAPIAALAVIPERLQVEVGLRVFLTPFTIGLPRETGRAISRSVRALYSQMSRDRQWRRVPSVTGYAAMDLVGISPRRAHAFIYVPESAHGQPKKAVIFLHGSLGNLKAYLYLWSRYAEDTGSLIVCPTFGFGGWSAEENVISTVMNALPDDLQVPRSETVLAGLSAGGYGVVKELGRHPDYRAAVFISAVMPDVSMIESQSAEWGAKPFLLFHGTRDFVVSERYAREKADEYRSFGARLELFSDESHFLFMTRAPVIFKSLERSLQRSEPDGAPD